MKIGSYIYKGKTSYGVEVQDGIFDLGSRIGDKYPNLQILIRSFALAEANKLSSGKSADFSQDDIIFLPLMPDNINIYCAGINYLDHIQEQNHFFGETFYLHFGVNSKNLFYREFYIRLYI